MYLQCDYSSYATTAPATFTLDYSDNGSSWTTLQTWSSQNNWFTSERRKYTVTGAASHAYWRLSVSAVQSSTALNINDWILENASGQWITNVSFFDCIPPAGETIGDSYSREVLRWIFPAAGTTVTLSPHQESMAQWPQMFCFYGATAGAVTCSITIGGTTVSYSGSAGYTTAQNARGLYEACRNSGNANFTAFYWIWPQPNNLGGSGQILAITKTPAANIAVTSSNITTIMKATYFGSGIPIGSQLPNQKSLTIDLVNGWIYYLQVNNRGIALATKTNANSFTPVHACYMDNATAVAQVPTGDLAAYGIPCTVIELIVGTDDVVANTGATATVSHWWGVPRSWAGNGTLLTDVNTYSTQSNFSHHHLVATLQDLACSGIATSGAGISVVTMVGEGLLSGADNTDFSIHKMLAWSNMYYTFIQNSFSGVTYGRFTGPDSAPLDWYKFTGAAPANEQLLIGPVKDFTTTVATTGTASDATISVVSTTGFPAAGWICIDGEIIKYTGVSGGNTFTGCTRAQYGTTAVAPIISTVVMVCGWWVFMVQGLVFGGYATPT
jgi:hypothetical protein